jgi:DNA-binding transcriptional LysR family regulator
VRAFSFDQQTATFPDYRKTCIQVSCCPVDDSRHAGRFINEEYIVAKSHCELNALRNSFMRDAKVVTRASGWSGNWTLMRDIEVVCAVVAERKTTGAALRLGVSQPAVSRAISKIEKRLGKSLFHREAGRLVPTDDALVIFERGCKIFETLAEISHPLSVEAPDRFTILAPPTIANFYLSAEVSTFAATQPRTVVSLDIALSHELPNAIAEGRGNLGVMDGPVLHSGVASDHFLTTSGVCLLPKGHPLAGKRLIQAADLDGLAYIAVYRRHPLRARLDRIFGEARVAPRIVAETDLSTLACDFVCKGLGVSVLNPFPLLLHRRPGFVIREFAPQLDFQTNLIFSANDPLPPPARRFVDILKSKRQAVLDEMKALVAKE